MNTSKFVGCTMILIGTTVGAGMLALPMVAASAGFTLSTILMFASWILATILGLIVIEVNLALPIHACSFSSMAEQTLGRFGKTITWFAYLFLLYAITAAYISGESSLVTKAIQAILHAETPSWLSSLIFTVVLGGAVFWSTKIVDYFNRGLISIKGFLLVATLAFTMPHVDIKKLITTENINQAQYLWAAAPIFICSFCYHFIVPSLRIYIGDSPSQLRKIVISGTTVALVIYLLWLAAALGTVPVAGDNSFTTLARTPNSSVGEFIQLVISIVNNSWVASAINGFANIAMTTSFLGVGLGLFDFLADGFKRPDTRSGRLQTALLTFTPPLLFALFYPDGFIIAINYAAVSVAILTVILPALMVYYLRKHPTLKSPYRAKCSNSLVWLIVIIGLVLVALPIMSNLHLLPTLK